MGKKTWCSSSVHGKTMTSYPVRVRTRTPELYRPSTVFSFEGAVVSPLSLSIYIYLSLSLSLYIWITNASIDQPFSRSGKGHSEKSPHVHLGTSAWKYIYRIDT
jgi:hypothetical protein